MPETDYPWKLPLQGRCGEVVGFALVDEADYRAFDGTWWLSKGGYAVGKRGDDFVYLHREVLGLKRGDGKAVDHKNRDKLDNRRSNLRLATQRTNAQNVGAHSDGSSRFRGVSRRDWGWIAQAGLRDSAGVERNHYLGVFGLEVDAAAVAAQWRAEHMPGAIEDPDLLAHEPTSRLTQRHLTDAEAFAVRWAALTTSLSHRAIADMLSLSSHGPIGAILDGRSYQLPKWNFADEQPAQST